MSTRKLSVVVANMIPISFLCYGAKLVQKVMNVTLLGREEIVAIIKHESPEICTMQPGSYSFRLI